MDLTKPDALHRQYSPRVALVTGAAQGIGYAIAHRLADDGIDVAVNDISDKSEQLEVVASELRAKGRRGLSVPADVSSETDVITMVSKTVDELGCLDIVSLHYSRYRNLTNRLGDDCQCRHLPYVRFFRL